MPNTDIDLNDLFSVGELAERYPRILSENTIRYQLRDRDRNGLSCACVQIGKKLLISDTGYRRWLAEAQRGAVN